MEKDAAEAVRLVRLAEAKGSPNEESKKQNSEESKERAFTDGCRMTCEGIWWEDTATLR